MQDDRDYFNGEFYDDEDDEDTQKDKYLTFFIGSEEYCISIGCVIEVIGMLKITHVPEMPDFVKGVINLRGQVIPVTDVRARFSMELRDYTERTCIIVVHVRESLIGLVVDTVNEVLDIPSENVAPPPKMTQKSSNRFILGMGKTGEHVKIILDVQKLLFDDEG